MIKYRLYILGFFFVLACFGIWGAASIETLSQDEQWLADDHYIQLAMEFASEFSDGKEDGLLPVHVVWGIKGINREGSVRWDLDDYGKVVYDSSFDMSSGDAQLYMQTVCAGLKSHTLTYSSDDVTCMTDYLELYLNETYNSSLPWTYMDDSDSSYNSDTQYTRFNTMMHEFSKSTYGILATDEELFFVDEVKNDDYPYRLRFIQVYALATIGYDTDNVAVPGWQDKWDDYIDEIKSTDNGCVEGVCKPLHISELWTWLPTENAFVRSAIQGILIAMPLAFLVLLLSTKNWIVALFAILDIIGIMLCELGLIAAQGWEFGISESISVVIIIGFSVDYVVHVANAYLESTAKTRLTRLRFSLLTIGISVVSGAVTTFIAGFFLLFPVIIFFQKMGILMMSTVAVSLFWAMTFFTAMLAQFGPEFDQGSIQPCLDAFYDRLRQCKAAICGNGNDQDKDADGGGSGGDVELR